jgi:hypothetical protein
MWMLLLAVAAAALAVAAAVWRRLRKRPPAGPLAVPSLPDTAGIFGILAGDYTDALDRIGKTDTQTNRRNFVRAVFALVEGMSAVLGQIGLAFHSLGAVTLTQEEADILADRKRAKFSKRVRCAIDAYAAASRVPSRLDTNAAGWQALTTASLVRDRIVHPKTPADCVVSDTDLQTTRAGATWFVKLLSDAVNDSNAVLVAMGHLPPREPAGSSPVPTVPPR